VSKCFEFSSPVEVYLKVYTTTRVCRLILWTDWANVHVAVLIAIPHLASCHSQDMCAHVARNGRTSVVIAIVMCVHMSHELVERLSLLQ
jgi:hypothetical protein